MLLGAHVSAAGGVSNAPRNGTDIGAETIQIFCKNQRQWVAKPYGAEEVAAWKDNVASSGLREIVVHDSYLINLCAEKPEVHAKSMAAFADEMARCAALGIPYLNFHPGSHVGQGEEVGIERIIESLGTLIDADPDNPTMLLVENTAGQGTNLGYTFEQCADIIHAIGRDRMGLCIDTQHTLAAGYDHRTREGYDDLMTTVDDTVGLDLVRAFHLNDSKTDLGSKADRHENLGNGHIGWDLFGFLVNDVRFAGVPGVLETPGPENWADEIAALKALRGPKAPDRQG